MSNVQPWMTKVLMILALAGGVAHCINEGLFTSNPFMETTPHGSGSNVGSISTRVLLAEAALDGPGNGGGGIGGSTSPMVESSEDPTPTPTPTPTDTPNGPGNGGGGIGGGT